MGTRPMSPAKAAQSALIEALTTPGAYMDYQEPPSLGLICFRPDVTRALVAMLSHVTAEEWSGESGLHHRTYRGHLPSGLHVQILTDLDDAPEIPGLTVVRKDI